jgi:5-methylcytosine-specific restriction endonuclease McrA
MASTSSTVRTPRELDTRQRPYRQHVRKDPCAYCTTQPAGTVDHIIPKSRGAIGGHNNITAACEHCNVQKGTTTLLLYLLERLET